MEQKKDKNGGLSAKWILLELTVIVSVFSQIASIASITRPTMYVLWGIIILVGCINRKGKIPVKQFTQRFILAYALFGMLCLITGLFNSQHFAANYLRILIVPLLVTIAGDMYSGEDRDLFYRLSKLYLLAAVIYAIWVQITYIPSYSSWLNTRMYLFKSKNSAGQIWVAAIFLIVWFVEFKNKVQKYICYASCFYLLIMTGICQCRTAMLSIAVALGAFAVSRSRHKIRWIFTIVVCVIVLYSIPFTRGFIEQALFLNKYAGTDLNTFSSGRIDTWKRAFDNFALSPIVGVGKYYVDSSYLLILAESGLLGFFLIEWIWVKKILICYNTSVFEMDNEKVLFFFMTTFYIVESLLEGYPPFGPGVSSFMFWFLSSALSENASRSNNSTAEVA